MKKCLALFACFYSLSGLAQERSVDEIIRSGNDFYEQQQYAKAAEEYAKAAAVNPNSITARFNQANALYKQDKKVDAAILLTDLLSKTTEPSLRAGIFYNKGVILSAQKNLEESIEAYKNALRNDPSDQQARENLQKALLELKKKKEEKKKQDQQKKEDQKKQQQPKMNPKEAEQRLKLLQQKEKETQERVQREKTKTGGSAAKDW